MLACRARMEAATPTATIPTPKIPRTMIPTPAAARLAWPRCPRAGPRPGHTPSRADASLRWRVSRTKLGRHGGPLPRRVQSLESCGAFPAPSPVAVRCNAHRSVGVGVA
eukprot:7027-Pyramimonas_sp.AAC.1